MKAPNELTRESSSVTGAYSSVTGAYSSVTGAYRLASGAPKNHSQPVLLAHMPLGQGIGAPETQLPSPSQVSCVYMPFVQLIPQSISLPWNVHWPPLSHPVGCEQTPDPSLHLDAQQFPPSPVTPQMFEAHCLSAPHGEPGDFKLPPVLVPPVVFPPLVPPPVPLVVSPAPVPLLELLDDSTQATIAIMIPNRAQVFMASSLWWCPRRRTYTRGRLHFEIEIFRNRTDTKYQEPRAPKSMAAEAMATTPSTGTPWKLHCWRDRLKNAPSTRAEPRPAAITTTESRRMAAVISPKAGVRC